MRHVNQWFVVCLLAVGSAAAVGCTGGQDDSDDAGATGGGSGVSGGGGDSQADSGQGSAGNGSNSQDGGAGSAGHDGGGGSGAVDAPPAIADLAEKIAGGVCAALLDCVGPTKLASMVGGEDCTARVTAEFLNGEFAHLQASIDADRVVIDADSLDDCVAGVKALGCDIETYDSPAACEAAVEGKVALGAACTIDSDCVGTAFCKLDGCPSACAELLGAGATCSGDAQCGDGLVCNESKCEAPEKDGGECAGTTGKVCALGWNCWNGDATTTGECHTNAETLVVAKGKTCEPGSTLCQEGLSCVFDGSSAFQCEAKVATGAKCHRGLPGQCPTDNYCSTTDPRDVTLVGTCKPLPGDGVACVFPGVCAPSFVCVPDGADAICRPVHDNGGACTIDAECRSGYCTAMVCEPPPVCP